MTTDERLEILKELLLTDEQKPEKDVYKKIKALEDKQEHLSERVNPLMDARLNAFVQEIPKTLGPTITETLKTEIKKSQDAVAEALYPVMGKMIKKYVQAEIKKLNDDINQKLNKTFSFKNWFNSKNDHQKNAAALMAELYRARIEQIMVIEKGSGLLKANYSKTQRMDEDMVAGMLTAIKSFVEDAFTGEKEMMLERIDYELFTIHLQNFSKYYIAVVLTGIYDDEYKSKLEDVLLDFAQFVINEDDLIRPNQFNRKLKEYFTDERI
ncbi:cell envelope biogenesis protein OmpA [Dokdonia sinensis]|uniref:Cell envelope biogenesis protein OmpA n=1 Tax=Dokdonia sinensis TaxID=2479847 RepID=A0A3M0GL87_9FLAO|nr:cell envelope biogenesis protein OmpA [Dokdonia sinensis]RMB63432.1 cell envelope biogenesis protein OmpA [Dokdonia sinensis]